jgi:hypothetical protein
MIPIGRKTTTLCAAFAVQSALLGLSGQAA